MGALVKIDTLVIDNIRYIVSVNNKYLGDCG